MDKNQAIKIIYSKYDQIKNLVNNIEDHYFQKKTKFHEDITHDLFLKIHNEMEKIENDPDKIIKFVDRYISGKMSLIYTVAKNMYIDFLRKEKKYVRFDYASLSKKDKEKMIEDPNEIKIEKKSLQEQIDDFVKTFYWFDQKVFELYRYEFRMNKTTMSKKTRLSISTIYRTVKRCKIKIKDKYQNEYWKD